MAYPKEITRLDTEMREFLGKSSDLLFSYFSPVVIVPGVKVGIIAEQGPAAAYLAYFSRVNQIIIYANSLYVMDPGNHKRIRQYSFSSTRLHLLNPMIPIMLVPHC